MDIELENLESLKRELERYSRLKQVAFAASCCERLLPAYHIFVSTENCGNPSIVNNALDEVWQVVGGSIINISKIHKLRDGCLRENLLHEDRIFESRYDYEAQQAVSAIYYALEACLDKNNIQPIINVVKCVKDTIYEFLIIQRDEMADEAWYSKSLEEQYKELSSDHLVLREIARQGEDLQRLKEVDTLDREFLEQLRTSNEGKSVLDLS